MATKKLSKIPILRTSGKKAGTIRQVRRETNDEILLKAFEKRGFIRIHLGLKLLHPETNQYCGWKGANLVVEAPSIPKAREFRDALPGAVYELAKKLGLEMPGAVIVEGGD